ncbi:large conductance mechanosensitive channel protein MscL [Persicimonas caeni]|uniref:Large-conductance mechanosensitive channel n=1 Tax=Persicimonas caeni TaxID=2292766 RepID=A0A4Y6Q0J3_PERCE|nr:large conductance mechanosensitive channel protein MscL [Persicimonas caeni]QDG54101.1 large conductance mechanosensitive channel protein MscL [Persicimonas caeni]QED35322.1 large conductance mechanosensitive channel protein MscL [Persicimonas caeni]
MSSTFEEFKKFAKRGNIVDMSVGVVIGVAFGAITKSLVDDVIMPPIGLLTGGVDFSELFWVIQQGEPVGPYATIAAAKAAGAVTVNYGNFVNTIINFVIIALAMFFVVRSYKRLTERQEDKPEDAPKAPVDKECPYCFEDIPFQAVRCPKCTSHLDASVEGPAE